jgi:lipopolysaccharide export system protein LptA
MVLAAGVVLVVALCVFLGTAKFRNRFLARELPKRLGIDIRQEANGVTYSHALGAHSQFKIHATKAEQLKSGLILLHEVQIELFGQDGERIDRIEGHEFEYNDQSGTATAAGPVEITLIRPMVAPAIAPKATADKAIKSKGIAKPLANAAEEAASGEIHVKTSGITSNWHTGVTSTDQRVDFTLKQGAGSSTGASFDSQHGLLVLSRDVELVAARVGGTVRLHAQHAEFSRDALTCNMNGAAADFRDGQAKATEATVLFRQDGSAKRLDANKGFTLATNTGGRISAPAGSLDFDEHNQPQHGHLAGGVQMESITPVRQVHGSSPTAELVFSENGELRHAHLERGVDFTSDAIIQAANDKSGAMSVRTSRHWHSPVLDVEFREAGPGKVEPAAIHGTGGVVLTSITRRGNAASVPSQLAADDLSGQFGPDSSLLAMTGVGHASLSQSTDTGAFQTANGDRIEAHFAPGTGSGIGNTSGQIEQVQSAVLDGHVVLVQEPAASSLGSANSNPGAKAQPPLRATAGKAEYESAGQWLHLTTGPRAEDGGMQVTADKIDISQQTGNAFAHGNVKATWLNNNKPGQPVPEHDTLSFGGQGPAHAIASEVQIDRATEIATFTGHARLWQQDNSISAPVIVLNRSQKTLVARSSDPSDPVRVVALSASSLNPSNLNSPGLGPPSPSPKSASPSVIRARGSQLTYSDADRKAVMVGGQFGQVVAETGTATSQSNQVELLLAPSGTRTSRQGQVDRMTASGHVIVSTQGRRGTGEQLTYTGNTGEYVLTGTPANPPQISDADRGTVTGEALIFHSRDDSVSIEGGGREARTETIVRQVDGNPVSGGPVNGRREPKK